MQAFSVDDLHMHPDALAASAQAGQLALVTNQGRPLFVSVPFDETMLREGIHVALAVNLFRSGEFSSGKAAELARMSKIAFIEFVSRLGVPVVDYPADEIKVEMAGFD